MKKKDHIEVLGLMSGTSLDGLDMAFCRFPHSLDSFEILDTATVSYPNDLRQRLSESVDSSAEDLALLNVELGKWMGSKVRHFLEQGSYHPDLIASHGHTVFHQPENGLTVQIGNSADICAATDIQVVSDFRSLDIALGGQGAPLVPIGDELLFSEYTYCLNLGGIANISYHSGGGRSAFDLCACNMVLNHLARREGLEYDRDGSLAAGGNHVDSLARSLESWSYLSRNPPKSLGFEQVKEELFPLLDPDIPTADLLHTFSHHIAATVAESCVGKGTLLITGGGAHNTYLRRLISEKAKAVEVIYPEKQLVDFKEALVFAFLGALWRQQKPNVLSSVTGADFDHVGGSSIG